MIRKKLLTVATLGLIGLGACSTDPVAPNGLLTTDTIDYLADFEFSSAAVIDGAGIGGARLPDELQLTADQKAAIAALHDAFRAAHADQLAALREIEQQLRQLHRSGGSRDEARALMEQARTIHESLSDAFAALQDAIWAIYTAEQKAWIESHKPKVCDRNSAPQLTEAQIAQIRSLKQAFETSIADETCCDQGGSRGSQGGAAGREERSRNQGDSRGRKGRDGSHTRGREAASGRDPGSAHT